jgi:hypothetical protein
MFFLLQADALSRAHRSKFWLRFFLGHRWHTETEFLILIFDCGRTAGLLQITHSTDRTKKPAGNAAGFCNSLPYFRNDF